MSEEVVIDEWDEDDYDSGWDQYSDPDWQPRDSMFLTLFKFGIVTQDFYLGH